MDFDRVVIKEGVGVGFWIRSHEGEPKLFSYKLYFDFTNNIVEHEALVLGLRVLKNMNAKNIYIFEDSKLVINQVKRSYQADHPRLRSYRNLVVHLLDIFKEQYLSFIPRKENVIVDALTVSSSAFKLPFYLDKKYKIEVRHINYIPNNVDQWNFFEDDK